MVTHAPYLKDEDRGNYSNLQVLSSAAGYYVGTIYTHPEGWSEPGSRDTDYFNTRDEAETALRALMEDSPDAPPLRVTP